MAVIICRKCKENNCKGCNIYTLTELLENRSIKSVSNVVDVVRCKNCKHSYYDSELEKYWCTNYSGNIEKSADGFCDDGKPRSK